MGLRAMFLEILTGNPRERGRAVPAPHLDGMRGQGPV